MDHSTVLTLKRSSSFAVKERWLGFLHTSSLRDRFHRRSSTKDLIAQEEAGRCSAHHCQQSSTLDRARSENSRDTLPRTGSGWHHLFVVEFMVFLTGPFSTSMLVPGSVYVLETYFCCPPCSSERNIIKKTAVSRIVSFLGKTMQDQ